MDKKRREGIFIKKLQDNFRYDMFLGKRCRRIIYNYRDVNCLLKEERVSKRKKMQDILHIKIWLNAWR